ncbi:MAG TPA: hypothetical protein VMH48_05945 [Methylomirabilota bacterium]|nr:hypothetical protein [Methylomirabilota bacterium]
MFTLFTIPKAFKRHIGVIQRNVIGSWAQLARSSEGKSEAAPEIILFGRDEGTAELARELGLRHIPDVATNGWGTPLLDDLFHKAEAAASFPTLAYVNADIILLSDFLRAVRMVQQRMPKSLLVSKRINLDVPEPLAFESGWEDAIKQRAKTTGADEHYSGIDIFLFPKGMYKEIPDFAIGRLWFDHWLIKAVRLQRLPVIDASRVAPLLHQRHDYNHVPGGAAQVWRGEEAARNFQLYGGIEHAYTLLDVTHELTPEGGIRRVRFRKPLFKMKQLAWKVFVERTAGVRHALGLRRKTLQKSGASS